MQNVIIVASVKNVTYGYDNDNDACAPFFSPYNIDRSVKVDLYCKR